MSSLKKKSAFALAWDFGGGLIGQASGFIISIFLARILEPEEFGLVGMSMVFINILGIFMDLGFASALIQNKNNTSITYSSVFYLNVILGAALTILLFFSAPLVGDFYDSEIITTLVRLLSITFFLSSFNIVQSTILRRALNFKSLAIRDLSSQVIAGLIAIVFAYKGFGVYALIIQQILAAIFKTLLLWKITVWYPKLEFSWSEIKNLSGFSLYILASQSVNQLIIQADTLLIGKLFSPATLGFYSRANSLNALIYKNSVSSITRVFFPALSTIQDEGERFQKIYLKLIDLVAGLSVLLTGVLFLGGEELIVGLFGEKWEPSVLIFQILIIKGFTYPISSVIVSTFLAKGKSKENFHYGNIRKVIRIIPFFIAYFYGFYAFLYAIVAASIIGWILNNYFITVSLGIPFKLQVKAVLPYLMMAAVVLWLFNLTFPAERSFLGAGIQIFLFVGIFMGYSYIFNTVLFQEFNLYKGKVWLMLRRKLNL